MAPGKFTPIAAETGMILEADGWALLPAVAGSSPAGRIGARGALLTAGIARPAAISENA